jgi:hypothetical protein
MKSSRNTSGCNAWALPEMHLRYGFELISCM